VSKHRSAQGDAIREALFQIKAPRHLS